VQRKCLKKYALLFVVFTVTMLPGVDADQTTTGLAVKAKVVDSCRISTPINVGRHSIAAATQAVRVRCDKPTVWRVDVDGGTTNAQTQRGALRVTISF
jgi:spore coat protein U-like protein